MTDSIIKLIDITIENFLEKISTEFNIDKNDLSNLWNNSTKNELYTHLDNNKNQEVSLDNLNNYTKSDLVNLCRDKGLKVTGTKDQLIERLKSQNNQPIETKTKETKTKETKTKETKTKETKTKDKQSSTELLQKHIPQFSIRRNKFGNFEHDETGFIFSKFDKTVIGKQLEDGTIAELTREDIENCNKYKFKYTLPSSLNKVEKDLNSVKIDGIDDDNEEEEEEEIIEELEEEEEEEDDSVYEDDD